MKFLFDQNLAPQLAKNLQDLYQESLHIRDIGPDTASDDAVWDYAKVHNFTIVTKDSDFPRLSVLYGHPPKVI